MDEGHTWKLSKEAAELFLRSGGFDEPVVDLRPLLAVECENGPSVMKAADKWKVQPGWVLLHVK